MDIPATMTQKRTNSPIVGPLSFDGSVGISTTPWSRSYSPFERGITRPVRSVFLLVCSWPNLSSHDCPYCQWYCYCVVCDDDVFDYHTYIPRYTLIAITISQNAICERILILNPFETVWRPVYGGKYEYVHFFIYGGILALPYHFYHHAH